jgi:hypothetical protein
MDVWVRGRHREAGARDERSLPERSQGPWRAPPVLKPSLSPFDSAAATGYLTEARRQSGASDAVSRRDGTERTSPQSPQRARSPNGEEQRDRTTAHRGQQHSSTGPGEEAHHGDRTEKNRGRVLPLIGAGSAGDGAPSSFILSPSRRDESAPPWLRLGRLPGALRGVRLRGHDSATGLNPHAAEERSPPARAPGAFGPDGFPDGGDCRAAL